MPIPAAIDPRPVVTLLGEDGNAFSIIARCRTAWRKAGQDADQWKLIMADMLSGSYNHLLQTAMAHFDVE
jgi:hypothetical protein